MLSDVAPSVACICGRATLAMVVSITTISVAAITTMVTSARFPGGRTEDSSDMVRGVSVAVPSCQCAAWGVCTGYAAPTPYLCDMSYRLSVLDQTPIAEGSTAADALANTLDLARTCDALVYDRYWLAEHHASPGLAGVAPEALIGPVALATKRIRVGSGGIMLPHYSPFKVAETFALLSALAPNRIDLGVGRAPGSDQRTAYALQRDRSKRMPHDDFPNNLAEMIAYFDDAMPADHPLASLGGTMPSGGGATEVWLLGSSPDSAIWAGEAGLPYCIADFINSNGEPLAQSYRDHFKPSAHLAKPHVMVATWTIAAQTHAEAERLALPASMMMAHLIRGEFIPVP